MTTSSNTNKEKKEIGEIKKIIGKLQKSGEIECSHKVSEWQEYLKNKRKGDGILPPGLFCFECYESKRLKQPQPTSLEGVKAEFMEKYNDVLYARFNVEHLWNWVSQQISIAEEREFDKGFKKATVEWFNLDTKNEKKVEERGEKRIKEETIKKIKGMLNDKQGYNLARSIGGEMFVHHLEIEDRTLKQVLELLSHKSTKGKIHTMEEYTKTLREDIKQEHRT